MKKLIINADDFGLSASVNRAIVDCYLKGNVTSTTLMVNMPGAEDAAKLSHENPGLGVGLHFCLTEGAPLTAAPSLREPSGAFLTRANLMKQVGAIPASEIETELKAQLERARHLGVRLTHIDSHQHVHMHPKIFPIVAAAAKAWNLPVRVVRPVLDPGLALKRPAKFVKQALLRVLSDTRFASEVRRFGVKTNQCLVSIHELAGLGQLDRATYQTLVEQAPVDSVVELMVHPYPLADDVKSLYTAAQYQENLPFLKICDQEYRFLLGENIFANVPGIQLTTYANV